MVMVCSTSEIVKVEFVRASTLVCLLLLLAMVCGDASTLTPGISYHTQSISGGNGGGPLLLLRSLSPGYRTSLKMMMVMMSSRGSEVLCGTRIASCSTTTSDVAKHVQGLPAERASNPDVAGVGSSSSSWPISSLRLQTSHISSVPQPAVELGPHNTMHATGELHSRSLRRQLWGHHHLPGGGHHKPGQGHHRYSQSSKLKPSRKNSKRMGSKLKRSPPIARLPPHTRMEDPPSPPPPCIWPAPPPHPDHKQQRPPPSLGSSCGWGSNRSPPSPAGPAPAPSADGSKKAPPSSKKLPPPRPRPGQGSSPPPGPGAGHGQDGYFPPGPAPSNAAGRNVFNVLTFGAKGDGRADDTQAFQLAWLEACQTYAGVLLAPQGYTFLVGPILFVGPCQPKLVFQVDGVLEAPRSPVDWKPATQKLLQWLEFAKLHDMTLQGLGIVNGFGEAWWNPFKCKKFLMSKALMPVQMIFDYCTKDSPTGVRFYSCVNVAVRDLSIKDSPQVTLKFDNCISVTVDNVRISTPADSPNTDGIHLQNTRNVLIQNSVIASGDDCISVQTGCLDVVIRAIVCGPGHGISIGGLGADGTTACVSNITVQDASMHDTQNGLRIKTWQGGSGSVKYVVFKNITVANVANPIIIDQFYCNGKTSAGGGRSSSKCGNSSSAVGVSDVSYAHIRGTYAKAQAVYLACSDALPCLGLSMTNIHLVPAQLPRKAPPGGPNFCWNSYGSADEPSLCLQSSPPNKPGQARLGPDQCQLQ